MTPAGPWYRFIKPDSSYLMNQASTHQPPHAGWILRRSPAEISAGDFQRSATSAKIVSGLSLEMNRYLLACLLPRRGGTPKFQTQLSSPSTGLVPIRKPKGRYPCSGSWRVGMHQRRVIRIGSQDYVAAPHLLIRRPFVYDIRLQLRSSSDLRRATLILKPLGP